MQIRDFPGFQGFYLEAPPYGLYRPPWASDQTIPAGLPEEERYDRQVVERFQAIASFQGPLDSFCQTCGNDSVFRRAPDSPRALEMYTLQTFHCSRVAEHHLFFALRFDFMQLTVMKVGQLPSLADLAGAELRAYRKTLPDDLYSEFNRAVGLASYGVGVGAFVYLRRVFERLLEEAHERAKASPGWDASAYNPSNRTEERIRALADFLPEFLVKNRGLYGILSMGLHTLTEEECLSHFPVVRTGIELILDDKLAREAREAKMQAAQAAIAQLTHDLKGKTP